MRPRLFYRLSEPVEHVLAGNGFEKSKKGLLALASERRAA